MQIQYAKNIDDPTDEDVLTCTVGELRKAFVRWDGEDKAEDFLFHLEEANNPPPIVPGKKHGDTWETPAGWFGESSEGTSGPWKNKQAAEYAANDEFEKAGKANLK